MKIEKESEIERLHTLLRRAAEALEPFSQQAAIIDENHMVEVAELPADTQHFRFFSSYAYITVGDCRRAEAVLADLLLAQQLSTPPKKWRKRG